MKSCLCNHFGRNGNNSVNIFFVSHHVVSEGRLLGCPWMPHQMPLLHYAGQRKHKQSQGGSGTEPEPGTGTVGTAFPETESGTGTAGTVFQEPKPEPSFPVKLY